MRKSLFTRYITVFMLIIFVSFTILALVIGSNMTVMTLQDKKGDMENAADNISTMITEIYRPADKDAFSTQFGSSDANLSAYIRHLADFTGEMRVYIFDASGKLLMPADTYDTDSFSKDTLPENILSALRSEGHFNGYDDMDSVMTADYLYSIRSVFSKPAEGEPSVIGYVLACSPAKGLNIMIGSTVKTILLASLWVFLAALVAVYFLSERIIGPLKNMSKAAKSYAAGNFDIRIPVQGNDEVAELAAAFNQMASGLQNLENALIEKQKHALLVRDIMDPVPLRVYLEASLYDVYFQMVEEDQDFAFIVDENLVLQGFLYRQDIVQFVL